MHKGLALAIIGIIGISMIGVGHMSGSGNDDNKGWSSWWKNFDYKKFFNYKNYDYKKFIGFMSNGGSGDKDHHDDEDDEHPDSPDQSPVDSANISFNIGIRDLDVNGEKAFQNIVDQCIFSSEDSFAPLCVKCKFLDDDGITVVAKGELIDTTQSYAANTEIVIPMTSVPEVPDGEPVNNDVKNVHRVELSICGFTCVPIYASFTDLKHGSRETAINNALASSGISVSGDGYNGLDEVIIFDADKTGTADPDLQVGHGFHLLILPETGTLVDTSPADGYIDSPNDAAAGGTITIKMDTPKFLKSFVLVDHENDHAGDVAKAYSDKDGLNLIKTVHLPTTANGQYTTVIMNAANVQRLDVTYADSGGITNIDLKCDTPEQNCSCEKPDKFTVKYHGPNGVKVVISKNGKDQVTLPGTYNDGDDIVVDAIALGFKNGKVYPETTYTFKKNSKEVGEITIHTSCLQTLYVGQEFFYMKGTDKEIQLTVVSGTLKGEPSIPDDASCTPPPEECDCKDDQDHYEKYYDNHKKYYDDNKKHFSFYDYKEYMDEHKKYLDDYGKSMDKSEYKKHIDYFKKFLDDNKKKFSGSDYRKYSDDYKKYSDDYKNHDDSCKCGGDDGKDDSHKDDGKDHHDKNDKEKDSKHKDDKNSKDYQYKYGKDHDD